MYYWTGSEWKKCNNTNVDTERNVVWANVTHLTIFAPMAEKISAEPMAPAWMLYTGIVAIIVLLAVSFAVIAKKRKKLKGTKQ
ncbi:MAG: hypothetical protein QMD21_01210 [Candidatus Thermoplasmatota archaeon]|nr:hypothetical protein [Candidatus Thermoplasmatota archaeon]